ncbi:MAG: hypothetical protein WC933_00860 [Candidatus Paceibacterota bacterium]|jgi:hypothetical protein
MIREPDYEIIIVPDEKTKKEQFSLEDAVHLAMSKNSSNPDMKKCIMETSNETGWKTKDISKALNDYKKTGQREETQSEKDQRDIDFGIAERNDDGSVKRLYND